MLRYEIFFKSLIQEILEMLYNGLLQVVAQQATNDAYPYFPYIFVTFMFICFSDVLGMLPFGFTITAHLCITFFLAFSFNTSFVLIEFFDLFVPKGAPKALVPLIVGIEVVSYTIRSFSLSIRLFANMMAGHCLLYVISSFIFPAVEQLGVFVIVPVGFIFSGIFVLELSIAFLQAYVFTILLCIYLNDSLHPGH
jgi:ATP synthase subunit 6